MSDAVENKGTNRAWARFVPRLCVTYAYAGSPANRGVESKVLDLSGAGLRFRAEEKLFAGALLDLKLMFPGEPMPVCGKVIRVLPCEKDGESFYEVAAAFLELDEDAREKIDTWFYREKMDSPRGSGAEVGGERRRSERFQVSRAYAEIRKKRIFPSGKWQRGVIKQLSRHGGLLLVRSPLNCGDKVETLLYLPAYKAPLRVLSVVVRVKTLKAGPDISRRHEIGLEFIKIRKTDLEKFGEDEYLQNLIERADSDYI